MWLYLVNHLDKRWSSLIEIMAMMAILGLAITAMFSTVIWGIYFATDSENRIKAINIAREWLEGVTNLRNTNWLRFSSDQSNCWRIIGYQSNCIWNSAYAAANSLGAVSVIWYVLENKNGAWYLNPPTTGSWLWVDNIWFYFASGTVSTLCTFDITTNCKSPFTREVQILLTGTPSTGSLTVTSRVDWFERRAQNVTIQTTLTNWKSKF